MTCPPLKTLTNVKVRCSSNTLLHSSKSRSTSFAICSLYGPTLFQQSHVARLGWRRATCDPGHCLSSEPRRRLRRGHIQSIDCPVPCRADTDQIPGKVQVRARWPQDSPRGWAVYEAGDDEAPMDVACDELIDTDDWESDSRWWASSSSPGTVFLRNDSSARSRQRLPTQGFSPARRDNDSPCVRHAPESPLTAEPGSTSGPCQVRCL